MGSPLLSYLDVQLYGFLPRGLTLGEAQRFGLWQIKEGSLLPVKDSLIDRVFQNQAEHIPIEEPNEEVQVEGRVVVESVNSSLEGTVVEDSEIEMVVRRTMIADRVLPGERPTPQQ